MGFEPAHKGFVGPRRVLLGPFSVIASNPVKGFHSAWTEIGQACSGRKRTSVLENVLSAHNERYKHGLESLSGKETVISPYPNNLV